MRSLFMLTKRSLASWRNMRRQVTDYQMEDTDERT
jgi:hypothetical protein